MNDPLKLAQLKAPAPDAAARLRAKRAALAEFARVQAARETAANESAEDASQGNAAPPRPSRERNHGSFLMSLVVRRTVFGALGSICVVAFATAMLWPIFSRHLDSRFLEPPGESLVLLNPPQPEPAQPGAAAGDAGERDARERAARSQAQAQAQSRAAQAKQDAQAHAISQPVPPPEVSVDIPLEQAPAPIEEYVVAGYRGSLQSSVEVKREAVASVDAITAEDIGQFPDANVQESLQRMPGVSIAGNRQAGQGAGRVDQRVAKVASNVGPALGAFAGQAATPPFYEAEGADKFQHFETNPIKRVAEERVSTFSVDVDTASYSFARRMLNEGRLPQKDAIRVEEMINYFDYAWPKPESRKAPFEATVVVSNSPWNEGKKLVHIGIKGYELDRSQAPDANLVLLLDVSGSMNSPDKLPLAVRSMELLLESLKPTDTVAIVVYAGAAGQVLAPTPVKDRQKIVEALRELRAGGSTAGAEGIELAYELAEKSFRKGGVNRVLLATDGDFNVGINSTDELKGFVERKREKGIFLSVLGFGQGNYRDELAQALAQNGNGVAAYIDTVDEARKVLVTEASGSLFTIAKDVKLQVEFNPETVVEYRLVGYETRALKREDFNNDKVDAGDVGAGHTVTALYEITPAGSAAVSVDALRYGDAADREARSRPRGSRNEYGFLKIRYKLPDENTSKLITQPIPLSTGTMSAAVQREVQFSTAVAGFAQLLKGGTHTGKLSYEDVIRDAQGATGADPFGYRNEFVRLVKKAESAKGM